MVNKNKTKSKCISSDDSKLQRTNTEHCIQYIIKWCNKNANVSACKKERNSLGQCQNVCIVPDHQHHSHRVHIRIKSYAFNKCLTGRNWCSVHKKKEKENTKNSEKINPPAADAIFA